MRDLKIYILIASLFLGAYLVAEYNKPKPVNWTETFDRKDRIPFGSYVFFQRLKDFFPKAKITTLKSSPYAYFQEFPALAGCYIVQSNRVKLDKYDFSELKKYMVRGNDVFISANHLGEFIEDSLHTKISYQYDKGSEDESELHFVNKALQPQEKYNFDKGIGMRYFSEFDTAQAVILGVNANGDANFIRYRYGYGHLYILAGPHFLTNYSLLKPEGARYASKVLSYLRPADEIIWDEYSSLNEGGNLSPLRVIVRHKELKWAYFTALFGLVFFVLYEMKRRQRIIPVIAPLQNSTTEFVKVVGQLYYQQRDNADIAGKKIVFFLEEIRAKYNLKTSVLDKEFEGLLAKKSGADVALISSLIKQINYLKKFRHTSDHDLILLNKNIELFYQQSK